MGDQKLKPGSDHRQPFEPPEGLVMVRQPVRRHDGWRLTNSLVMFRTGRNMSQAELAEQVGVSRQTIGAIENRRHEPVLSLAMAIAEVFGAKVEDIFRLRRPSFSIYERHKR